MLVACGSHIGRPDLTAPQEPCETSLSWTWPEDGATGVPWDAIPRLGLYECDDPFLVTLVATESGETLPSSVGSSPLGGPIGHELLLASPMQPSTAYTLTFQISGAEPTIVQFTTGEEAAPPPPDHSLDLDADGNCYTYGDDSTEFEWHLWGDLDIDGDSDGLLVTWTATGDSYPYWDFTDERIESWVWGEPNWFGDLCITTTLRAVNGVMGDPVETCVALPDLDPETDCEVMD